MLLRPLRSVENRQEMAYVKVVWKRVQILPRMKCIIVGMWETELLWAYFDLNLNLGAGVRNTSPHFCNNRTHCRYSKCWFILLRNQLGISNLSPLSLSLLFFRVWFFSPSHIISFHCCSHYWLHLLWKESSYVKSPSAWNTGISHHSSSLGC